MRFGKRIFRALAFLLAFNAVSIPVTHFINNNLDYKGKTIVFASGKNDFKEYHVPEINPSLMVGVIDFFMYTPITLRQSFKRNYVEWRSNPTLESFVEDIQNPEFENIILIGHGRKDSFALYNGSVDTEYLKQFYLPPRQGEFYQYTCGNDGDSGEKLKDLLFRDCTRSTTFDRILDPFSSYVYAWTDSADSTDSSDLEQND